MYHFPVFCTLRLLTNVDSTLSGNSSGMSLFYTYSVSSIFLGDSFYDCHDNKVNSMDIYLTNFTNFVYSLMNGRKIIDKPNYLGQIKSSTSVNSFFTYHLCQSNSKMITNSISSNFIGVQNTYFVKLDFNIHIKNVINLCLDCVTDWFSLISNNEESDYKFIVHTKAGMFNYIHPHNLLRIKNHYKSLLQINIKDTYLTSVLSSLKNWIIDFEILGPIFQNINIDNFGKLNQQLQNICVDFEMIFDSYVSKNKAKEVGLVKKIYEVLKQMNTNRVSKAMNILGIKSTKTLNKLQVFSRLIQKYRNCFSHDPKQSDFVTTAFKLKFLQSLKVLVANWLLSQIQVDSQYVQLKYTFNNPFNIFNLKNRFV